MAPARSARLRARWIRELLKMLREFHAPVIAAAEDCFKQERGVASEATMGTLRGYLTIWQGLRRWLLRAHGAQWPAEVTHGARTNWTWRCSVHGFIQHFRY